MTTVCIMQAAGKATQPASQTYIQPARRLVTARQAGRRVQPHLVQSAVGAGHRVFGGPKALQGDLPVGGCRAGRRWHGRASSRWAMGRQ